MPVKDKVILEPGHKVPEGEIVGLLRTSSEQVTKVRIGKMGIRGWLVLGMRSISHLAGSKTVKEKTSTHVLYIKPIIG